MAIAFDATTDGGSAAATTLTFSHTCTGSNLILFVGVQSSGNIITGITYNGAAMTLVTSGQITSGNFVYLYYLIAPATGANNVAVSASSSAGMRAQSASYTGAKQSGQPDSSHGQVTNSQSSGAPFNTTTTTVADNCWAILVCAKTFTGNPVASTGSTFRQSVGSQGLFDSNGALTPAGSKSMAVLANDGSQNWYSIIASFAPFVASATIPRRGLLGVGI